MKPALDCLLLNAPDLSSRYPYLGITTLAGVLRENGITVALLDTSAERLTISQIISDIRDKNPRIIGLSLMSPTLRVAYQLIQAIKANFPEKTIVVGGAHLDACPESLPSIGVEYGFYGECEYEFLDFCKAILAGEQPQDAPCFIRFSEEKLFIGDKKILPDLNILPRPAYDLLPMDRYYSPSTSRKAISCISSRGCPYNCLFCSKLHQKKYRYLSCDTLMDHLHFLVGDLGVEWVEFVDEIFTLRRERIVELCNAIIDSELDFEWGCGTRVDKLDEDLLLLMKEAGCHKIGFGVETGSERVRDVVHKRVSDEQIYNAVRLCRKHKIQTQTCFIFGHPTETLKEMLKTIRFAQKLRSNYPAFSLMIPIPGSELFELAKSEGKTDPDVWTSFMLGRSSIPIYSPNGVSPKVIKAIFRLAWFSIYLYPASLWDNRKLFFNRKYFVQSVKAFLDFGVSRKY